MNPILNHTAISRSKSGTLKNLFLAAGVPGYILFFKNILYYFITRQRSFDEYAAVDDSAIFQILFVSIAFTITIFILYQAPQKRKFLFASPQIYLLFYILICFLSMIWAPNIFITGYRAFEALTYLLLISLIAYNLVINLSFQDIIRWSFLWLAWDFGWTVLTRIKLIGFSDLFYLLSSPRLVIPMFFFFALFLARSNYVRYVILLITIVLVSNKIYVGIAVGFLGLFFGDSKYKGALILSIIAVCIIIIFVDIEDLLLNTIFYGRESVGLADSSGRNKIWLIGWEAFIQKPIIGYGYVSGESMVLWQRFKEAISMHNFFFSGVLGTGILGTVFLIAYFWSVFKKASSSYFPKNKYRPAMVSTVFMCIVISSSAPGIGGRVYGSWIPVVLVLTLISSLHYKFKISSYIKKFQNYENNLGHAKFP